MFFLQPKATAQDGHDSNRQFFLCVCVCGMHTHLRAIADSVLLVHVIKT